MKKNTIFMCLSLGLAGLFSSCTSERSIDELHPDSQASKKGKLTLNLSAGTTFQLQTRSVDEASYSNTGEYTVEITSPDHPSFSFTCKGKELESNLPKELEVGSYTVKAFYGIEHPASQSEFYVEGTKDFTISTSEPAFVNVPCTPTCGKISVDFDENMDTYYDEYSVSFNGTTPGTFAWAQNETLPWYVKLDEKGETINYTITVKAKTEFAHVGEGGNTSTTGSATGSFTLQRNFAKKLTITPHYTPGSETGLTLSITIDKDVNPRPIEIEVPIEWI